MEIHNKFEIGQELYTIIQKPIQYKCPVCDGTGKFNHNNYEVRCPHCIGIGKLTDTKTLWGVTELVKIRSIKIKVDKDVQRISYLLDKLNNSSTINRRCEDHLFINKEDAEKFCYNANHPIESNNIKF